MKKSLKHFIFELLQSHPTQRCSKQRHLERPCIGINLLRWKLGLVFLQGLFICSCFQIIILSNKAMLHISSVQGYNTFKAPQTYLLPGIWIRSQPIRFNSKVWAQRENFVRAFSFFSLCFFKLSTSFFPFSPFSFNVFNPLIVY